VPQKDLSLQYRYLPRCVQVTFKGGTQQMHGWDYGAFGRPDLRVTITNTSAEQIINVFGTATGSRVTSIGFKTSKGTTYVTMGPGEGSPFSVDGLVLGFVGALENGALSGIGVWYLPMSTSPPGPVALPVTSLEMSAAYGNLVNVWAWDDTPDWGGARPLFLHFSLTDPSICLERVFPPPTSAGNFNITFATFAVHPCCFKLQERGIPNDYQHCNNLDFGRLQIVLIMI
jgi:hypothetical protein